MTAVHLQLSRHQQHVLLATAAVSSASGLAAELLLGTLASYLVGNQALAYGAAVGGFLAAMGLGSYLSQFIGSKGQRPDLQRHLLHRFVQIELLIAPLTAVLPLVLFALFVVGNGIWLGLALATILLGTLAGMEVPLLTRIVERDQGLRGALAGILALDYLGALLGSLVFPILLLPVLGLFPAAAVIGSLPAVMVVVISVTFPQLRVWRFWGLLIAIALWLFSPCAIPISNRLEDNLYSAPVISRTQSPYQRIVLTRFGRDVRLFLDGDLQFSTLDEYRYHEALVHPAMSSHPRPERVMILGAGDGLALREVLKWPTVNRVLLIELDDAVVHLAQHHPALVAANQNALADPRVDVRYADAFHALPALRDQFDVIIADFPDPDQAVLAKLYTKGFYQQVRDRLAPNGVFVTQASSPFFAPRVMACITATAEAVGWSAHPYVITVPSFGVWGFVWASRQSLPQTLSLPVPTRFLTEPLLASLFQLPADIQLANVDVNRLSDPVIVRYQTDPRWSAYD